MVAWAVALRGYLPLALGLPRALPGGCPPTHWPRAWRSAALVRAGGQGRLGEQGPPRVGRAAPL